MEKERRDVQRSKEAIKTAFIELSLKYPIEKITVAALLDTANVSRGTFYAHFRDIYDVRDQVESDFLAICKEEMAKADIHDIVKNPYPQILRTLKLMDKYSNTIRSISGDSMDGFFSKLKRILVRGLVESSHTIKDKRTFELIDSCIIGAVIDGCVRYCVQKEKVFSQEEAALMISNFVASGTNGMK